MVFRVKHLNIGHIYGRFNQYSGSFAFDDKNPADCKLEMEVKIDSIDSANGDRDKHLKGPDFFSAKEFPTMSFKATGMKASDEKNYEVTGDLTIHGVTKQVTVKLERIGTGQGPAQRQAAHRLGDDLHHQAQRLRHEVRRPGHQRRGAHHRGDRGYRWLSGPATLFDGPALAVEVGAERPSPTQQPAHLIAQATVPRERLPRVSPQETPIQLQIAGRR